ncbi:regulatory protein Rop [Bacillus subtilis BEST7003]|nr:regulatory protein Rop [Bacillus subtilis BEST7613]BAM57517.1 regulatory protein Rop [Bacillus subtilis BEST7003]
MTKQEKTALNMARFIRSQTLTLLEKLNELDADEQADICESLHDHADELYRRGSLGCRSKFELGTLAAAACFPLMVTGRDG